MGRKWKWSVLSWISFTLFVLKSSVYSSQSVFPLWKIWKSLFLYHSLSLPLSLFLFHHLSISLISLSLFLSLVLSLLLLHLFQQQIKFSNSYLSVPLPCVHPSQRNDQALCVSSSGYHGSSTRGYPVAVMSSSTTSISLQGRIHKVT